MEFQTGIVLNELGFALIIGGGLLVCLIIMMGKK